MSTTSTKPMVVIDAIEHEPEAQAAEPTPMPKSLDSFVNRHIGPDEAETREMLTRLKYGSLDELIDATVPSSIRWSGSLGIAEHKSEADVLDELRGLASKNKVFRSYIGMGYFGTVTPPVIQRTILENPCWYTQYSPYQAEISQGRLEALINFQTMVADLTALPLANASLLDEATAAAEAMAMCFSMAGGHDGKQKSFFIAKDCHPQTIAVVETRARSMGVELIIGDAEDTITDLKNCCGVLVQYPTTDGRIVDYSKLIKRAHEANALVVYATDLLALTLIKPPGEWGADIAVGSSQRFGVPMGFGGPHAAFLSTKNEYARKIPGRIIGVSKDAHGNIAYRMAIQTREQHIKRERATSNICTAQVLLAIIASMYAVYHGPKGLRRIALRIHELTNYLANALSESGYDITDDERFDTIRINLGKSESKELLASAHKAGMNLREYENGSIGVSLDATVSESNVNSLFELFGVRDKRLSEEDVRASDEFSSSFSRTSEYLTHPVFNQYHSETELLRYVTKLQSRDLSLTHSMIPLGSCTMKLNAAAEMLPITWPEFGRLHPFAPEDQWRGYAELFARLEKWLAEITGFAAVSLQPNSGAQGEYAGLLAIRAYHDARGDTKRDVCLIPVSAHGTNPASATIAGLKVVPIACDSNGNVDLADLKKKCVDHRDQLAALMITYPSTHGVFEEAIKEICQVVHEHGGQVYMDGANLNAMMGLCRPAEIGADVCHINLHKTFCIPHGGGGPGMGPIGVAKHLTPFLPTHPLTMPDTAGKKSVGTVSAAPYGSPSILPISYAFIAMMGADGLKRASQVAILNANYMAERLKDHYDILYTGKNHRVGHEFIIDCRPFEKSVGIKVEDIAKRLMDYGFHAPTMSFPVPGTLMIEPTESESKAELDRYCDALISIREEIRAVETGNADREDNVLKNSPHTIAALTTDKWKHPYSREQAGFPAQWLHDHKFWPPVGRIDNPYGDRNLFCTCPPMADD